jgi:hypothetical protein
MGATALIQIKIYLRMETDTGALDLGQPASGQHTKVDLHQPAKTEQA